MYRTVGCVCCIIRDLHILSFDHQVSCRVSNAAGGGILSFVGAFVASAHRIAYPKRAGPPALDGSMTCKCFENTN